MRLLVDECTGQKVVEWLRDENHEVFSVFDEARGITDDEIITKAFSENWILITNDKDFGEMVFRERRTHHGVILMRLEDERAANKIEVLRRLLEGYAEKLPENLWSSPKQKCVLPEFSFDQNVWSNYVVICKNQDLIVQTVIFSNNFSDTIQN